MCNAGPQYSAVITGAGAYVPEKVMTNEEWSKLVDTNDEWITTRTGIKTRHFASEGVYTSHLAINAGRQALEDAGVKPEDIDLLIVATICPDRPLPSTASFVQAGLGLVNAGAFDLVAACSGFVYALDNAKQYILSGSAKRVLVIGAETMSRIIDWQDRASCVIFGDGAGAVVLERVEEPGKGILSSMIGANGNLAELLRIETGGTAEPLTHENLDQRRQYVKMEGNVVFKHAVRCMSDVATKAVKAAGLELSDINWLVPHQANTRIIDAVGRQLGIDSSKVVVNIHKVGNTTAASIPLALKEAVTDGRIKKGDNILIVAFGAGLTWGSSVFRWEK
jgi:3-oxoacyl-[acyl-carrier-protein] synthase-3